MAFSIQNAQAFTLPEVIAAGLMQIPRDVTDALRAHGVSQGTTNNFRTAHILAFSDYTDPGWVDQHSYLSQPVASEERLYSLVTDGDPNTDVRFTVSISTQPSLSQVGYDLEYHVTVHLHIDADPNGPVISAIRDADFAQETSE